jgi:hypothetical protein
VVFTRSLSFLCAAIALLTTHLGAQTAFFSLKDVKPGLRGVGKTVFRGTAIEQFDVEILGVLENIGPKQSIILARLSGGPLEHTGVMQGMSGSPVYIDGKLVGAVAMAFPFSKDPIAGIRPIAEMIATTAATRPRSPQIRALRLDDKTLVAGVSAQKFAGQPDDIRPADITTPVAFSGFSRDTLDTFAPQLRLLGLEPRQGISAGRAAREVETGPLQPGSMISVQLVSGDMAVGADGTVTHVDDKRVYAFGHRFLAAGETELPFTNASVLTLLPNLSTSYKISASGEPLGAITTDHNAAISGELGRSAAMASVNLRVDGAEGVVTYKMNMVRDPLLSPMLLQMMLYSALDSTERTLGAATVRLQGKVRFEGVTEPVQIENMYAGDYNVPLVASMGTVLPVAYALQNSVDPLRIEAVDLAIESLPQKRAVSIEQVWLNKRKVRPGETVDISVLMVGEGGHEFKRTIKYEVPVGAPTGPLHLTVADGATTNASEQRVYNVTQPRPAHQIVDFLNSLRGSTKGYVRLWRADPAYTLDGQDLPDPPPSVGLILAKTPGAAAQPGRTSTVAEIEFSAGDAVITGSKTVQIQVEDHP